MNETCATCRFWGGERAHNYHSPYGTCRVQPPAIIHGNVRALPYHDPDRPGEAGPIVYIATWPWTAFDDWCGEHQSKAETADAPTAL